MVRGVDEFFCTFADGDLILPQNHDMWYIEGPIFVRLKNDIVKKERDGLKIYEGITMIPWPGSYSLIRA